MLKSTQVSSMAQQLRALASGTSVVDANVLKALMPPIKRIVPTLPRGKRYSRAGCLRSLESRDCRAIVYQRRNRAQYPLDHTG